ncbi:anti-sigma factor [Mycobacterium heckeshornense]|uniref:Anti-sigma-K factor RskA n=1 Tax=Mycobacterium heckeshornense TaxID=110505 RepID=A0A2G8BJL9_9MYCO|nr:anti-sigma factor [Mycobacterium heckeshornense]KMV24423.1 anti-sigma K factor [Mycobacterium heckeshornense]MCV7035487.1 anti-sigma factor [Mycobacterium heckeshornense]PIJ37945.1 anti-sigma factor [Mycobacterium heckeshornense]BCO37917.1 anti-sigma-K factor RskA [Mycobacterium heckeshornense]BCQ10782.1 anti-sigma-K factor RskA [Mycobacterium heckeshornense]
MTEPTEFDLLEMATPYALDAVSDTERADIERQVQAAPPPVAEAFHEQVRAVRETMAVVSAVTGAEPPAHLRSVVLAAVDSDRRRQKRWRTGLIAAAAAIVVGLAAFGVGAVVRPFASPTVAEQVLTAPDVRTVTGPLLSGGSATIVFSRDKNAGVLVMNNVPPPPPGSVYQMWLLDAHGPTSAGTMDTKAVAPSTTAVIPNLGSSSALAFTVEPGNGSPRPTGRMLTELPLT